MNHIQQPGGSFIVLSHFLRVICKSRPTPAAGKLDLCVIKHMLSPTMVVDAVVAQERDQRVYGAHVPTMPSADTALDRPDGPFWAIFVRFPKSRRLSNSRTSCWLYTCCKAKTPRWNKCMWQWKKKKVWFDSWSADRRIWVVWSLYSAWCSKASTNCLSIILCYDTHNNNGKNDSMWWWILTGRCFIITISIIVIIIITTHHCYEQINSQQLINACSQFASQTATNALKRKGQFDNKRPRQLHDYIISTALMLAHLIINDDQILGFCAVNLQHSVFGLSLIAPHQKIPLQRGGGWWWGRYCV